MEMLLPKGPSILGVPFHCQPGVNAGAECKLDDHDLDKNQGIWKVTQISIPVLLLPYLLLAVTACMYCQTIQRFQFSHL